MTMQNTRLYKVTAKHRDKTVQKMLLLHDDENLLLKAEQLLLHQFSDSLVSYKIHKLELIADSTAHSNDADVLHLLVNYRHVRLLHILDDNRQLIRDVFIQHDAFAGMQLKVLWSHYFGNELSTNSIETSMLDLVSSANILIDDTQDHKKWSDCKTYDDYDRVYFGEFDKNKPIIIARSNSKYKAA